MKTEYWTLWGAGSSFCSKHKTAKAAERAARACERRGGMPHKIIQVRRVKRASDSASVRPAILD